MEFFLYSVVARRDAPKVHDDLFFQVSILDGTGTTLQASATIPVADNEALCRLMNGLSPKKGYPLTGAVSIPPRTDGKRPPMVGVVSLIDVGEGRAMTISTSTMYGCEEPCCDEEDVLAGCPW